MLKEKLAARLEDAFSEYGFAEPSVAQLKTACDVSLRTLYKYYPSKEAMIVAALEYRHQRYLAFLTEATPQTGIESVLYMFERLELWMERYAPHGCMSLNAIAAFPDNQVINLAVKQHKEAVRQLFAKQSGIERCSTELFLLHEGVSNAWPVIGKEALTSAQNIIVELLSEKSL